MKLVGPLGLALSILWFSLAAVNLDGVWGFWLFVGVVNVFFGVLHLRADELEAKR